MWLRGFCHICRRFFNERLNVALLQSHCADDRVSQWALELAFVVLRSSSRVRVASASPHIFLTMMLMATVAVLASGSFTDDYLRQYARLSNASEPFAFAPTVNSTTEDKMAGKTFVHLFEWKWSDVAVIT